MSAIDWKLEVVPLPVSDIDRAKHFYAEQCGFVVDLDLQLTDSLRVVQLTPPGSACSIHIKSETPGMLPGSVRDLQIAVSDIGAAREELMGRGVKVSPIRHFDNGVWVNGPGGRWNSFASFSDPDGNSWVLQERPAKL